VGRPPFETSDVKSTYKRIQACDYSFPDHVQLSENSKSLISSILQADPAKRPTLESMMTHPFLSERGALRSLPVSNNIQGDIEEQSSSNIRSEMRSSSAKRRLSNPESTSRGDAKRSSNDRHRGENKVSRRAGSQLLGAALPTENIRNLEMESGQEGAQKAEQIPELPITFAQMNIGNNGSAKLSGSELAGSPVEGNKGLLSDCVKALQTLGAVWVSRWVDYSHKYGVGYMMCDGSVGVYFNDATKIVLGSDHRHVEYTLRRKDKKEPESFLLEQYPQEHHKKVTLLKHFQNYLGTHQSEAYLGLNPEWESKSTDMPYVKKWLKTRHAIILRLSNGLVQVNFFDNSVIILHETGSDAVAYVNKKQHCVVYNLSSEEEAPSTDMEKRLKYAREVLVHFSSSSKPAVQEQLPAMAMPMSDENLILIA